MTSKLDIVILGATGHTGMHCIPYMYKMAMMSKSKSGTLRWGIAGRTEAKLKDILEKMGRKLGADISEIPIILCDITDYASILNMAKQAKIVINCCGPYRFLGEPVVKACIEAGTHQLDVTGEPQYMAKSYLKYNELAEEKEVYVISACGLDCIPVDLGVVYLQQNFSGTLNSVVTYLDGGIDRSKMNVTGPIINYGTWESLIESIANWGEIAELEGRAETKKLPTIKPKLKSSILPEMAKGTNGWALPFLGADKSVVQRTQIYFYEKLSMRPVQIDTKFIVPSFLYVIAVVIVGVIGFLMSYFNPTKRLLLEYPELFTMGMFSKKPPSEELSENTWFQVTLYGEGWKEPLENKDDRYRKACDKAVVARVQGRNPGYGATCACIVGAAVVIATEADKIPVKGGVITPGIAFAKSSLINMLKENGVSFEIISEKYL